MLEIEEEKRKREIEEEKRKREREEKREREREKKKKKIQKQMSNIVLSHKIVLVNTTNFFLIFRKCRKSSESTIRPSCNCFE